MELLVRALLPFSLVGSLLLNLHVGWFDSTTDQTLRPLTGASLPVVRASTALDDELPMPAWTAATHLPQPNPPSAVNVPVTDPASSVNIALPDPTVPGSLPASSQAAPEPPQAPVDLTQLECAVPRSLMLHSAFGAERMLQLADAIQAAGLHTTTYRQVLDALRRGRCPAADSIIVSIDDLSTRWLRPDFREMIQVFDERGMVLVLALVVQEPQDPALWEEYRRLESLGHEVASHTLDHLALSALAPEDLTRQVSGSYRELCTHLERCPVSLVLPFGDLDSDGRVLATAAEYAFVVGIQRGDSFSARFPVFVGRIPPDNASQVRTLALLERSFQP